MIHSRITLISYSRRITNEELSISVDSKESGEKGWKHSAFVLVFHLPCYIISSFNYCIFEILVLVLYLENL